MDINLKTDSLLSNKNNHINRAINIKYATSQGEGAPLKFQLNVSGTDNSSDISFFNLKRVAQIIHKHA